MEPVPKRVAHADMPANTGCEMSSECGATQEPAVEKLGMLPRSSSRTPEPPPPPPPMYCCYSHTKRRLVFVRHPDSPWTDALWRETPTEGFFFCIISYTSLQTFKLRVGATSRRLSRLRADGRSTVIASGQTV